MSEPPALSEQLRDWLQAAVEHEASDLHLVCGYRPVIRQHGALRPLDLESVLTESHLESVLSSLASRKDTLATDFDHDLSLDLEFDGRSVRFRGNLFRAGGQIGACFRVVPIQIPTAQWAGLPGSLVERVQTIRDGLVIATGPTGSGKSTTLAIILQRLNQDAGVRIITVEEPVEYHYPKTETSLVSQREVGVDVQSFADGLKYGLRQDPDVILVGEIRDRDTAQMAISAAETGHLVLTTLHARDAKGAISRMADLFPQEAQRDIRVQLASSLKVVVSQRLLPDFVPGAKRHLALEILWNTNPIASAIRSGKLDSIDNYLLTGRSDGMLSFDESIRRLLESGQITEETAVRNLRDPGMLRL